MSRWASRHRRGQHLVAKASAVVSRGRGESARRTSDEHRIEHRATSRAVADGRHRSDSVQLGALTGDSTVDSRQSSDTLRSGLFSRASAAVPRWCLMARVWGRRAPRRAAKPASGDHHTSDTVVFSWAAQRGGRDVVTNGVASQGDAIGLHSAGAPGGAARRQQQRRVLAEAGARLLAPPPARAPRPPRRLARRRPVLLKRTNRAASAVSHSTCPGAAFIAPGAALGSRGGKPRWTTARLCCCGRSRGARPPRRRSTRAAQRPSCAKSLAAGTSPREDIAHASRLFLAVGWVRVIPCPRSSAACRCARGGGAQCCNAIFWRSFGPAGACSKHTWPASGSLTRAKLRPPGANDCTEWPALMGHWRPRCESSSGELLFSSKLAGSTKSIDLLSTSWPFTQILGFVLRLVGFIQARHLS